MSQDLKISKSTESKDISVFRIFRKRGLVVRVSRDLTTKLQQRKMVNTHRKEERRKEGRKGEKKRGYNT
jgi:hypothetical protein